jgi:signal transduction histidine kinase
LKRRSIFAFFALEEAGNVREHSIRVLLVDDDSVDADLTSRALRAVGYPRFEIEHAASLADAALRLGSGEFDVALLDLGLPDSPRGETLERFRTGCSTDLPVIVLTGLDDDDGAFKSLDLGAQDYLGKDDVTPVLLSRSIRYAMQRNQMLGQLKSANAMLAQKNERLGQMYDLAQQFVENVSHEFRTPLTVIREFTSIVRDGLDGPITPKQAEHLEKVIHRTDDLALMVDDMLDISKLEAGLLGVWRRPCRIDEIINTVRSLIKGRADSKRIMLGTAAGAELPLVYCDEEKARRVIVNLAVNAIKFTPEGGTVDIWARANEGDGDVTIGVTDTGPGLSSENLSIIFERFKQVDHGLQSSTKGFGLGLNIAKELVALNLGQIDVRSEVGAGSTFSFTLPNFEPGILLKRYLDRIVSVLGNQASVSLFVASIDLSSIPGAEPVVDEFLQRAVRANDLVVSYDQTSWIIAAICPECDGEMLVGRLSKEWAGFLRNSPNMKLPPLEITHRQTGELGRDRSELEAAYIALAKSNAGNHSKSSSQTVLVVDDDAEVSQCLGMRLKAAGFQVLSAFDGEAGLLTALECQPDAVVLDVRMPKKDGLTVLRELREHPSMKQTPIVMLSASIRDQHTALEAGASYFVPKPYEAAQVLSALESSLHQETLG